MAHKPTGTVTFLFTDIEGSTKLARGIPQTPEKSHAASCHLPGAINSDDHIHLKGFPHEP